MQSERWKRIDQLFDEAVELEPDKRALFLEQNCSGDPELQKEVEQLLAFDEKSAAFYRIAGIRGSRGIARNDAGPRNGAVVAGRCLPDHP